MTSNTLGIEVQPDVPKASDKEDDKESKDVISDDIKQDQSDEVTEDHEEHQAATREFPMWIKRLAEGLKDENKPKVSPPRRSSRPRVPNRKYEANLVALMSDLIDFEPNTFDEASNSRQWIEAMQEEYDNIMKNDVWDLVPLPEGKKVIGSRWIFKLKHKVDGSIEKYKARFVAKGFSQNPDIDYDDTFSPIARYTTIRSVLSLVASNNWNLHQMDVKTTFLNGVLQEEVYIQQPQGFEVPGKEDLVCRLKKALYGLKQAPHAWYTHIDEWFQEKGVKKSSVDANLYFLCDGDSIVIVVLYVDDLILTGNDDGLILWLKNELCKEFEMKDLGPLHYFLGLEVWQDKNQLVLTQAKYAMEVLKQFKMENCKPISTPMDPCTKLRVDDPSEEVDGTLYRQLVGSLLYLCNTHPDLSYTVNVLSQFMMNPKKVHW
jgi:hypothetical protein